MIVVATDCSIRCPNPNHLLLVGRRYSCCVTELGSTPKTKWPLDIAKALFLFCYGVLWSQPSTLDLGDYKGVLQSSRKENLQWQFQLLNLSESAPLDTGMHFYRNRMQYSTLEAGRYFPLPVQLLFFEWNSNPKEQRNAICAEQAQPTVDDLALRMQQLNDTLLEHAASVTAANKSM